MEKCFPMLCCVDINTFNTLHACTGFEPNRFDINLSTIINLNQHKFCCTTHVATIVCSAFFKKKVNKTLRLTQIFLRFSTTFKKLTDTYRVKQKNFEKKAQRFVRGNAYQYH